MTEPDKCYLCGEQDFVQIKTKMRYKTDQKIFRCLNCDLVFIHPKMTPDEERKYYEEEYSNLYAKEKGTTTEDLFETRKEDAKIYADWFAIDGPLRGKCLEVGCSSGYFLSYLEDIYNIQSISGVEIDEEMKDYAEENYIEMFSSIDECDSDVWDNVFTIFTLEHVGDPVAFLKSLKRVCVNGGKIYIVVPNINDILYLEYGIQAFKDFYFTPAHQFYYSHETLHMTLDKAGLPYHHIKPQQRYGLSNHLNWFVTGKPGGTCQYDEIFSKKTRDIYENDLKKASLCDTLVAYVEVKK